MSLLYDELYHVLALIIGLAKLIISVREAIVYANKGYVILLQNGLWFIV